MSRSFAWGLPTSGGERRLLVRVATAASTGVALLLISAFAISAAIETRRAAQEVRTSTALWNAYQDARSAIAEEELLEHGYRLVPAPEFERRFDRLAAALERSLQEVVRVGGDEDRAIAREVVDTNRQIEAALPALVEAVSLGDAARAERIERKRLRPLFRAVATAVKEGANAHRSESFAGLRAARSSETIVMRAVAVIFGLALLVLAAIVAALRYRVRLDSAQRKDVEQLRLAALTDSLTGLFNHRAFQEQLGALKESDLPFALLMLDLDGLKEVNDRYGHQVGDEHLKTLAVAIEDAALARGLTIGAFRLGGDEFAVIIHGERAATGLAFVHTLKDTFVCQPRQGRASVTAGIAEALVPTSREVLIRQADIALIEAKRLHRGALVYSPAFERGTVTDEAHPESHQIGILATALARAVDTKDSYTRSHCETVAELAALVAAELGLESGQVAKVRLAGLLHDVGKIGIADAILQKPGRLTAEEFAAMKSHPALGAHILSAAERHDEASWVLHHHERPDGRGYPDGLSAGEIPLQSLIIAVSDAFEAMIGQRPYRNALSIDEALEEMQHHAGSQFDGACVDALCRVFRIYETAETGFPALPMLRAETALVPLGAEAA